jgi:hydroxyethylthiazole kinase-like uncharacterized protein yjeF
LIIAGSRDVPGAGLLAAHGGMRAGAGKLQLAVPRDIAVPLGVAMPEAMVVSFAAAPDGGFARNAVSAMLKLAKQASTIVAGPGIRGNSAATLLAGELCALGRPLVLDAALRHALPRKSADARVAEVCPILLPHSGEMASLLECEPADVEADPVAAGRTCADRYNSLVLVKGVQSHIVVPGGKAWKYRGGGPGLGVSGSGDVLAGIVGGLAARGAAPLTALLWGVWIHGEAGRALAKRSGPLGFLARELPGEVPALLPR